MIRKRRLGEIVTVSGFGRTRTPGWVLHRVPMRDGDRHIDNVEAAETFASKPWAKTARYLASSRGLHVFEYDPRAGGRVAVDVDATTHKRLGEYAERSGISLDDAVDSALDEQLRKDTAS